MATDESDMTLEQIIKRKQKQKPGRNTKFNVINRNSKTGSSYSQSYSRMKISKKSSYSSNAVQQPQQQRRLRLFRRDGVPQQQQQNRRRANGGGGDNVFNSRKSLPINADAAKTRIGSRTNKIMGGIKNNITKKSNSEIGLPQISLFTKHFDARSKISSKKLSNKSPSKFRFKGVAQKALDDVRKENKGLIIDQKRNFSSKSKIKSKQERESTFTGKSIKIVAKNNLLSNTIRNKSKSTTPSSYANHSLSINKDYTSLSPAKKSVPAKVVINNLFHNVTEDDIKELFGAVGTLLDARLTSIGTAEVTYSNAEDAFTAYNKYHDRNLDGQPMILKIVAANDIPSPPQSSSSGFLAVRSNNKSPVRPSRPLSDNHRSSEYERSRQNSGVSSTSSVKPVVFTVKL